MPRRLRVYTRRRRYYAAPRLIVIDIDTSDVPRLVAWLRVCMRRQRYYAAPRLIVIDINRSALAVAVTAGTAVVTATATQRLHLSRRVRFAWLQDGNQSEPAGFVGISRPSLKEGSIAQGGVDCTGHCCAASIDRSAITAAAVTAAAVKPPCLFWDHR